MNEIQTLEALTEISENAKELLKFRKVVRPKLPRTFNRKEATTYLKSDGRTIEKVAEELGINWKKFKDHNIPWIMTIDEVYAVRDALPDSTILKKTQKKFIRNANQKCQILNVQNQKGGVGKTTYSVNLGTGLATEYHEEFRVCLIDMDGQSTLSSFQPSVNGEERTTLGELIQVDPEHPDYVSIIKSAVSDTTIPNLKIIPADQIDRSVETIFHEQVLIGAISKPYTRLASIISAIEDDFDIIIIDTPPSLGYASINAYYASTSVIFPVGTTDQDTDATLQYFSYIPSVFTKLIVDGHKGYDFINILISNNEDNSNSSLTILQELQSYFGKWLFAHKFNRSEAVRVCSSNKNSVFDLSPSSYDGHKRTFVTAQTNAKALLGEVMRNLRTVWGI